MPRFERLRSLPLRSKVIVTMVGAAAIVLGIATHVSFRYWEREALQASEQQARLAAGATRVTIESALRLGRDDSIRRHLLDLRSQAPIVGARVYAADGSVLFAVESDDRRATDPAVWIPEAAGLPRDGVVHHTPDGNTVRVFMPLTAARASLLEVEFSIAPLRAAMRRGARLGLGLVVGSVAALALIVGAMLEHEVVTPLHRVEGTLAARTGGTGHTSEDEVQGIERSVNRLLEHERTVEARIAEREGFAEVGELATEMAHEFKRPLASIRSALDVLQQEYRLDGSGRVVMAAVNELLELLTDTMQDLFSLARPVVLEQERAQVRDILDDALVEFAGQPGAGRVRVERAYAPDLPPILADQRRLRQAFANLMVNALEAMPDGGQLTLTTRPAPHHRVAVTIGDTGVGLERDAIERAFRPFYSTKPLGTGLGLPLVARVIVAHRGHICVDSRPGAGTTITLFLPTADAPADAALVDDPCPTSAFSSSTTTA